MYIFDKLRPSANFTIFLPSEAPQKHAKQKTRASSLIQSIFKSNQDLRFKNETALLKNKKERLLMVAELSITEDSKEGVHIFNVSGRLDVTSAHILEKRIQPILETPGVKVVVNFKNVEYLSSAGMRVMLYAHKRLEASKGKIVFCSIESKIMEIIKLAGFDQILTIFDHYYEALKALKIKDPQD